MKICIFDDYKTSTFSILDVFINHQEFWLSWQCFNDIFKTIKSRVSWQFKNVKRACFCSSEGQSSFVFGMHSCIHRRWAFKELDHIASFRDASLLPWFPTFVEVFKVSLVCNRDCGLTWLMLLNISLNFFNGIFD